MRVLIVESDPELGRLWAGFLNRQGHIIDLVENQPMAIVALQNAEYDVIILDLVLDNGSAFAVADFASYRTPQAKVIFVTNSSFFSDGSIFQHIPNACTMMPSTVAPEDLGELVAHYGAH